MTPVWSGLLWRVILYFSIGSMGLVYLPSWMVDFMVSKLVRKYTSPISCLLWWKNFFTPIFDDMCVLCFDGTVEVISNIMFPRWLFTVCLRIQYWVYSCKSQRTNDRPNSHCPKAKNNRETRNRYPNIPVEHTPGIPSNHKLLVGGLVCSRGMLDFFLRKKRIAGEFPAKYGCIVYTWNAWKEKIFVTWWACCLGWNHDLPSRSIIYFLKRCSSYQSQLDQWCVQKDMRVYLKLVPRAIVF